jgi:hypothetical protein
MLKPNGDFDLDGKPVMPDVVVAGLIPNEEGQNDVEVEPAGVEPDDDDLFVDYGGEG